MAPKQIKEGYTEFSSPQGGFASFLRPLGRVGKFFSAFFTRQGQRALAKQDDNKDDFSLVPTAPHPLAGDTVQKKDIIKGSVLSYSSGGMPALPESEYDKKRRYQEFESMDEYPEIGAAFDIYADNCNQENLDKSKWAIKTKSDAIKDEVEELFKVIELDKFLWDITRNTVKYGDCFIELVIDLNNAKKGIQRIKILDPNFIYRMEDEFGNLTSFFQEIPTANDWTSHGMAGSKIEQSKVIPLDKGQIVHFRLHTSDPLYYPYGKSIAALARNVYRNLKIMEDSMLIYRLCLTGDTRVSTNKGYKYIKDIVQGDEVYCLAGANKGLELTKVTNSWETGIKKVYEVKSKHFKVTGTDTHPILVLNKLTNEVSYVPIKDLDTSKHHFTYEKSINNKTLKALFPTRDIACKFRNYNLFVEAQIKDKEKAIQECASLHNINKSSVRNFLYGSQYLNQEQAYKVLSHFKLLEDCDLDAKFEGFCTNQTFNIPEYVDEEFAKLLGFMYGDGTIFDYGLTFAEGVYEDINKLYSDILIKYFGNCRRHPCKDRKYVNYTTSSTLGAELFKSLGFTNGAKVKRVPEWMFSSSDKVKKAFVLGFCDADGSKRQLLKNNWSSEINISNKELLEDIKELWTMIGLSSGHIGTKDSIDHFINDKLVHSGPSYTLFISDIPLEPFEKINSVSFVGEEKVYDIEVEHEKHNFIANGVIVHNSRSAERRIFYIDTGNLPSTKAQQHIRMQQQEFKKQKTFDRTRNTVDANHVPMAPDEDYYIAVNGRNSGTRIETLPGAQNLGEVDDVKYFRDKLLASLKVPKDYIVEKDQSPERKANLGQLDIKFARVVSRIQQSIEIGLETIAKRHLLIKGFPVMLVKELKIKLPESSDLSVKRQLDLDEQKARVVQSVKGLGIFPIEKIYKDYYQLSDEDIKDIKDKLKSQMKDPILSQVAAGGMGMEMDGGGAIQDPNMGGIDQPGYNDAGGPGTEGAENVQPTQNEDLLLGLEKLMINENINEKAIEIIRELRINKKAQIRESI